MQPFISAPSKFPHPPEPLACAPGAFASCSRITALVGLVSAEPRCIYFLALFSSVRFSAYFLPYEVCPLINDSMIRPQARTLSPEKWQEKVLDFVAPARPTVCPRPAELLSQRFTAVTNQHLVFARTDQRSLGLMEIRLFATFCTQG